MKTVLITGASSGIGKSTALYFSKKGWKVAATMRNMLKGDELTKCPNIKIYQLDVNDKQSVNNCVEHVLADFGQIDVVVNNAGVYTTGAFEFTPDEVIDTIVDTNIKGVMNVTKAVVGYFRERKQGVIVNISSVAGRVTFPFQSVYHTSKWAIEGFSEGLQYELNPFNIKVKVVEPGMVKTNLYDSLFDTPTNYPSDYKNQFVKWHANLMSNFKAGYNPELDAKTIYKAVTSKSSKLRYTSDFSTRFVLFLRSIFSLSAFQRIVMKICKMN